MHGSRVQWRLDKEIAAANAIAAVEAMAVAIGKWDRRKV